jgi:hypothetical protein
MTMKLFGVASLAAFVSYCLFRGRGTRATKSEVKEDLRRWEGEGGNVPAVATPSPAPAPQSSYPAPASEARH